MSEAQRCLTSIIVSWGRIVETGLKTKKLQVVEQNVHGGVTCHRALLRRESTEYAVFCSQKELSSRQ